ncbi:uncharacterized protein LOC103851840 isoform X1 [Brassica rapa]|uniref:UBZ4-type domain-containing protein n=1 Tax=Brassica campestris TaxID=3711 RepID=M4F3G0_BRACM|nr:uncharacterized protein LOC103851840 isoform X1 [Brassica rapa]XP_018512346.1 uncharacterized protein LOC103851840 isoform X1 [Brassica rapa]XP_033140068.1 uncharacterized protein LOC103851840 isoform X1 [Brassica rapa]XP_033140069.1 uncharacterized protein LOC103851840 isoform X1 [Brassica rapa]
MFLSTENPPRDPLSSSSSPANLLRLTTSPSHELGQSSFSIRDYAYSNRKNNIKNSWPFSTKSLHLCSSHGVTDPLPPFQKLSRLSNKFETTPSVSQLHQTIAEASKRVCNQSRIIEYGLFTSTSKSKVEIVVAAKSNNKSKKCGQGGGGGMVKTKGDSSGVLMKTASESVMASKTCPICKTFSSASNTTLNAHIDQCLSMDSSVPPVSSKPNKPRVKSVDSAVPPVSSKPRKPRVNQCMSVDSVAPLVSSKPNKPRVEPQVKVKTLVDIYTTAKRCTLEDLDRRNGTQWASVLSCTNRVAADKSEVSKKRKASPVGVGPVYIDAKGQKLRILTEFSQKKTLSREQQEDGSSEKKSSSQGSKENKKRGRRKKHGKCIKLTSHKANTAEKVLEYQREGSSKGPRRIYNQRMLAKRGLVSKKLNEKGHKLSALRYQPSDDDDEDDSWSGEDRLVLRGADTSATGSSPLNKQKLRSQVSGRSKTMLESKRAHSRSSRAQIEEKSLTGAYSNNTVHSKKSLTSIQEDKHPPGKNVRDASPRATSMRNLSPPFVANGWRRLSPLVEELKKSRFDLSDEEEEEETGKWESEMTQERGLSDDDDYVSGDDNPSFSRYYDYDDDDDDEESSDEEEEDDSNSRANVLDKSNDANVIIPSERAMYYSEDMIYGQTGCDEEDVRFGSEVRGKGSLFVEVDTIPIPGPPGSFLPSPRGMGFDGNSSVITSQFQSSMDQLDRNSSESPVSAVSNFASGRLNFQAELPSSLDIPMSFGAPSHHGTIPEAEPMSFDKATTPLSFRNNDHESCCCQRKERVSLNHEASHLLQRRAASSSSIAMSLTKSPTRLDPNHPFEQSQCVINRANLNGAVVPPSPSNSVLRLMGKDLMVMNQGEADSNEEASRTSLKPTPQFHDPQPCAGTGLYFNTGFYLRNSFEPKYEQQTPKAQQQTQAHQASAFRNNFDHLRYFPPS